MNSKMKNLFLIVKTDDNLIYDEKNNISVCVISLSSVIKKRLDSLSNP